MSREPTRRVIGGVFGLPRPAELVGSAEPAFLAGRHLEVVNASSAIRLLAVALRPVRAWVPSYLCAAVVDALAPVVPEVRFVPVGLDLRVASLAWLEGVAKGDLLILIDYFGFPHDTGIACAARERGAFVLVDAAQALLSARPDTNHDAVVHSPRKFLGVPDGGILQLREPFPALDTIPLAASPGNWFLRAVTTGLRRSAFDRGERARDWFPLYQEVERDARRCVRRVPPEPTAAGERVRLSRDRGAAHREPSVPGEPPRAPGAPA